MTGERDGDRYTRRGLLRSGLAAATAGIAGCGGRLWEAPTLTDTADRTPVESPAGATPTGQTAGGTGPGDRPPLEAVELGLETVAEGFSAPLDLAVAPGGDRRYVVEQAGRIRILEGDRVRERPFLDIADRIERGGEKGLLGLALHPAFAENHRCYVRYSAPRRYGTPASYSHTFVLAEFRAIDDGRRLDPNSERAVLEIPQPQGNHNAGAIAFGPDGHLYVAVGDGGAGGDAGAGHADDWYGANRGGNGQDVTENLLGSVLRIDVDSRDGDRAYGIPEDNPLVGREGLSEHYAWGLRNPWRMAFDGDDLIAGDVGQNAWEEVDVVVRGGNYGWNVKEGTRCYGTDGCPDETPDGEPLLDPVIAYPHSGSEVSGISVIGGVVYRGSAIPGLRGRYVFGDYDAGGRLFVADRTGDRWPTAIVSLPADDADRLSRLLSFGSDPSGELYVLGTASGGDGGVYRLVSG